MGPTCEVLLDAADCAALDTIDVVLAAAACRIERTRDGRVWDVWVGGRPVHISVTATPPAVSLVAGCNGPADYDVLRRLAGDLASALDGVASEPVKWRRRIT